MMRFGLHCLMIAGYGAVAVVESDFVGFYAHHCGWTRYFFFSFFQAIYYVRLYELRSNICLDSLFGSACYY